MQVYLGPFDTALLFFGIFNTLLLVAALLGLIDIKLHQKRTIHKLGVFMPTVQEELATIVAAIDAVATQIADLVTQLKAGSITVEQLDAAIQPEIAKLQAIVTPAP